MYSRPASPASTSSGLSLMPSPASRLTAARFDDLAHARGGALLKLARREVAVDEAPLLRALRLQALGERREHVGAVAPHLALIDEARQAAGAGQHAEQRNFGERDRRVAVVHQIDLVAGDGQLVAAARGRAVQRRDVALAGVARGVLDGAARLVRELAEVDLEGVRRGAEHVDVRARAEDARLQAGDDDGAHLRVLEAQALHGVGQLDVHAEVVAVELQLVALAQRLVLLHVHRERGDGPVNRQLPVLVLVRRRLEINLSFRLHRLQQPK